MTTNHPNPTPPPAEAAPSLRPVEESVFRAAMQAGAERLSLTHWNGSGCGTNGTGGCSRCYGPSPADAAEVAEDVLDAAWPIIFARLAAADRENAELRGELADLRAEIEPGVTRLNQTIMRLVGERNSARSQLAAAQAQLAEATDNGRWIKPARAASYWDAIVRRAVTWPGWTPFYTAAGAPDDDAMVAFLTVEHERADAAEARLEAVREIRGCLGAGPMDYEQFVDEVDEILAGTSPRLAALSAAPRPERGDVCDWCKAAPQCDGSNPNCTPTPECRHCNGDGIAHTLDGEPLGICGTCHGTGSAAGGGL